jgi:hypothetical protein
MYSILADEIRLLEHLAIMRYNHAYQTPTKDQETLKKTAKIYA